MKIEYKLLTINCYEELYQLWLKIDGLGLRSLDDSREGIAKFLIRNPTTCFAAFDNEKMVGSILCGHDGRRGFIYHTCVLPDYRLNGIAAKLVELATKALREEGINKVSLVAYSRNEIGNSFWKKSGWELRTDLNYYNLPLNENNI